MTLALTLLFAINYYLRLSDHNVVGLPNFFKFVARTAGSKL